MANGTIEDFFLAHLCEMLETPAGPGTMVGMVDRNGATMGLVDQGERMPGQVVVLRAVRRGGLNMEGALKRAMESTLDPLQVGDPLQGSQGSAL